MATGKQPKDIFASTADAPKVSATTKPRGIGRPKSPEKYQKVTVPLYDRHIIQLDKAALAVRERTGEHVSRVDLIRSLIDSAGDALDPESEGFDAAIRKLLETGSPE